MLWFQGAIPAAIAAAKQSGAVFVVFVAGDDEQSIQMAESWEDEKVTEASSDSFVAIKIDTKSEACLQFSQIYPVVCVPSSFFIGDSGIPLEVIAGSITAEELVNRIHKVRQMHTLKSEASIGIGSQSANLVSNPCSSFEHNNTSENSQARNVELCETPSTSPDTQSSFSIGGENSGHTSPTQEANDCSDERVMSHQAEEDLTVKVERLTKKLEERREEKRKEEEQKEIKKEIDRRKTGKEMLDYKRKQEEELTKRMLEERNREKAEDKAARERIKQQIALDRAERAARFAKTKEEVEAAKAAALLAKQAEMEAKKESSSRERSAIARIQFRLPDGSSFTNQFPSDAPLEEARQFAAQMVGNTYSNFSLATMFPRREFTKEDYRKKLSELELAPSASVVLLPAGRPATSVVQSSSGELWKFLGTVLYPFFAIWRLISNFLFTSPPPSQTSIRSTPLEHTNPTASGSSENREGVRKRVLEKRGEDFKKEGKIYRLRTQDDGEDENNTWNGNSTQQM
ncbi:UBX domain-containing protein 4 [Antechinus flavipes]|uniref:UBX domain-containing protein 4 n=2 Tax=Sarcophilus harrisii TaxID=9305 RepID=A0A7N4NN63_SARHA|nr:UBX domain-containing protein 4 isoform X1 [Sarcophilus harrisii]XP_051841761.1 UBX domain-containing protein 4 [Antechinus flavipes]